jgi:site-specific DNA-methyltransferase (adenine-specific)
MKTDLLDIRHADCMDMMREFPDKHFDLAIVDPPYGIGAGKMQQGMWGASRMERKDWDSAIPRPEYFTELMRVSSNQIIFGGNYFPLRPSRHFVVWDKGEGFKDRDFAECEQAWGSFDRNAKVFKYDPLANGDYRGKIHPTQKPVALYRWLLANYAKPGDTILDTHCGSGSIAIACHYAGHHLTACELDADYYKAACERIDRETRQQTLFTETPQPTETQTELI